MAPSTTRSGFWKSATAAPSRRNSGFDTTAQAVPAATCFSRMVATQSPAPMGMVLLFTMIADAVTCLAIAVAAA